MACYKLIYFNVRGRAELTRLCFAAAGLNFDDVRIPNNEWAAMKSSKYSTNFHLLSPSIGFFAIQVFADVYYCFPFLSPGKIRRALQSRREWTQRYHLWGHRVQVNESRDRSRVALRGPKTWDDQKCVIRPKSLSCTTCHL